MSSEGHTGPRASLRQPISLHPYVGMPSVISKKCDGPISRLASSPIDRNTLLAHQYHIFAKIDCEVLTCSRFVAPKARRCLIAERRGARFSASEGFPSDDGIGVCSISKAVAE